MKKTINILGLICALLLSLSSCNVVSEPVDVPAIVLENDGQVKISFEGGEAALVYAIDKPKEGAVLTLEVPETNDWLSATVSDTQINFVVAENGGDDRRFEMMTLRYTYGGESVKNYVTVVQEASGYEYIYDAYFGGCIWYGNVYSGDLTKYVVMLETEDGIVISLDLSAPVDTEDMLPPAEKYIAYEYNQEKGYALSAGPYSATFIGTYNINTGKYDAFAIGGLESTVEISREGDVYSIRASIVDDVKGEKYLIRYTGKMEVDNGLVESTLTDDMDKKYDGKDHGLNIGYSTSDTGASSRHWIIYVMGAELAVGQPVVYLDLYTAPNVETPAQLSGVYSVAKDDSMAAGTFVPGSYGLDGTWYMEISNIVGNQPYSEVQAPIVDGTVKIEVNAEGTLDITIDGLDDNAKKPHKVHVVLENVSFVSPE